MDFLSEIIGQIIWDILVVPLVWLLATPYILVVSFFRKGPYIKVVGNYYKRIFDYFWKHKKKHGDK